MTRSSCEETVERGLRQAGYRVYLPRYRKLLRPHGATRSAATSMRPLFPCMIFAQDWNGWPERPITGVIGLMTGARGSTATLSDLDVQTILAREYACEHDDVKHPPGHGRIVREDLTAGDLVEFEAHELRIRGTLERLSPKGQAIVRDMLGKAWPIDASALDVVSA